MQVLNPASQDTGGAHGVERCKCVQYSKTKRVAAGSRWSPGRAGLAAGRAGSAGAAEGLAGRAAGRCGRAGPPPPVELVLAAGCCGCGGCGCCGCCGCGCDGAPADGPAEAPAAAPGRGGRLPRPPAGFAARGGSWGIAGCALASCCCCGNCCAAGVGLGGSAMPPNPAAGRGGSEGMPGLRATAQSLRQQPCGKHKRKATCTLNCRGKCSSHEDGRAQRRQLHTCREGAHDGCQHPK